MTTLARYKYFDTIAFVICLIYIISQAFDDVDTPAHSVVHIIDYVTAVLLICETGLRLHSLRHVFLLNFWNFIDTIIVIFLVIGKYPDVYMQNVIVIPIKKMFPCYYLHIF